MREDEDEKFEKREEPIIQCLRIGIDHQISEEDEEINIQCGRVAEIENLSNCKNLKSLMLISNHINKIKNLDSLLNLKVLEIYQNNISKIENLDKLINLEVLDLSFNRIRKIENLENQKKLKKLFITNNRIKKIEGLEENSKLQLLELGSNEIRKIENIDHLIELEELWLGKNKITTFEDIPVFTNLRILSLQSNRLINWSKELSINVCNLNELYLSDNQLSNPPENYFKNFKQLQILDLGCNKINELKSISLIETLEELWINDNLIDNILEIEFLKNLKNLKTLYLERNPIQYQLGPAYRLSIIKIIPWIVQLDAIPIERSGESNF